MADGKNTVLDYESARSYNRNVFLLNHSWSFRVYSQIDNNFYRLGYVLSKGRDRNGKSYVSLIPFFLLMRRQAMNAFWALCSHQSFEAWVLLRPCLESALIVGKWTDDPAAAKVWENRKQDRESYKREYSGKHLRSRSLPRSDRIQSVLSQINDDFMHANPDYYRRHADVRERSDRIVELNVHFFDTALDHETHLLAFAHLLMVLEKSLSELLAALIVDQDVVDVGYDSFRETHSRLYESFLEEHAEQAGIIATLGLWPLEQQAASNAT